MKRWKLWVIAGVGLLCFCITAVSLRRNCNHFNTDSPHLALPSDAIGDSPSAEPLTVEPSKCPPDIHESMGTGTSVPKGFEKKKPETESVATTTIVATLKPTAVSTPQLTEAPSSSPLPDSTESLPGQQTERATERPSQNPSNNSLETDDNEGESFIIP